MQRRAVKSILPQKPQKLSKYQCLNLLQIQKATSLNSVFVKKDAMSNTFASFQMNTPLRHLELVTPRYEEVLADLQMLPNAKVLVQYQKILDFAAEASKVQSVRLRHQVSLFRIGSSVCESSSEDYVIKEQEQKQSKTHQWIESFD